jgi:hypothetical protein
LVIRFRANVAVFQCVALQRPARAATLLCISSPPCVSKVTHRGCPRQAERTIPQLGGEQWGYHQRANSRFHRDGADSGTGNGVEQAWSRALATGDNRSRAPKLAQRERRTLLLVAPAVLVAVWGVAWIASHASTRGGTYVHTLFQTAALTESVVALLLCRRKPVGALAGILVAYLLFQLDPLLLAPLLLALLNVALLRERRTVLIATAATAAAVAALPLTGRTPIGLAGYLPPRLLAVAAAVALGLWARTRIPKETR